MWAWCTKDSPEPIDDSMTTDIVGDVTTEKPREGAKRAKVENQDFNCLLASFEDASLSCNLCNADSVHLGCESVDKLASDLLVFSHEKLACCKFQIYFAYSRTTANAKQIAMRTPVKKM